MLPDYQDPVHLTVPAGRMPRSSEGLQIHRVDRFPPTVRRHRLITVSAATAVTTSWPLLAGPDQRAPAIVAIRKRLVTPSQLRESIARLPRQAGRAEVLQLIELFEAGCESELEIWGYLDVFNVPGLRHASRQKWITVRGRKYRLDQAYDEERVVVELDGAAYHSSPKQRERDTRRDAALATIGWLTLRYSHSRLHFDRDGCRRDTLATLAARR